MPSDSVPFLPPELEREILEAAAVIHPEIIPNLLLVSHRAHEWIERVKYRTVTPRVFPTVSCTIPVLQRAIRSNAKPASFFRDYVQHLFVEDLEDKELEEILSVCSGIQSLVLFQSVAAQVPSLGATRPRRLSLYLNDTDPPLLPNSMFAFVTHLDLFDAQHKPDDLMGHLALLSALTHLALWYSSMWPKQPSEVLERCSRLETLISMHGFPPHPEDFPSIDDVRFLSMVVQDDDYLEEWVIGTQGGMDFWARADAFIAKKRRGEIRPSSRCWIELGDGI